MPGFPSAAEHALLAGLVAALRDELPAGAPPLHGFLTSALGAPLPLHVSLSRPFALRTEQRDGFAAHLTTAVGAACDVPFVLAPYALGVHRSPDSGRVFVVLRVADPEPESELANPQLSALLGACNAVVAAAGGPELYAGRGAAAEAAAFHVSVAWAFAPSVEALEGAVAAVYARPEYGEGVRALRIEAASVKVKIGNAVSSIPLKQGRREERGLF